jgi:hypothetical protein
MIGEKENVAYAGEGRTTSDEGSSATETLRDDSNDDSEDCGERVWWNS